MSTERQIFPILEDIENGDSYAPNTVGQGDSPRNIADDAEKKGLIGFSFKDSSGNLVLPSLNPEGALPVTFDAGTTIRGAVKFLATSQTKDQEDDALIIPLTVEKNYTALSVQVSGTRLGEVQIYRRDDAGGVPSDTYLGGFLISSGDINGKFELKQDAFDTIGGTGTQELVITFIPLDKESDIHISASINEVA